MAIIIWMFVNKSITANKTFHEIPIRIINLAEGKTIEGLQKNGFLNTKINLTLFGKTAVLSELNSSDLEVVLNAADQNKDWNVSITPKNVKCLNPEIDIQKNITKVMHPVLILKISNLTTDKIPIQITSPRGKAPTGYLYLDIWPYKLYVTATGPANIIKQLKQRELHVTYNLNDITEKDLEKSTSLSGQPDELSFFIPDSWKKIKIPELFSGSIKIDDPTAKELRIDFTKHKFLPIKTAIPITLFFPAKTSKTINPNTHTLEINDFIQEHNGIKTITLPLFAHGVSRFFLDTIKDMIQIVVIASENNSPKKSLWNIEFIYPQELENKYIAKILKEQEKNNKTQEERLRNRFRNYMNKFRLYTPDNEKLSLTIKIDSNLIKVSPDNYK